MFICIFIISEKETEKPANISISNVEGSAKKKKKKLLESQIDQETGNNIIIYRLKTN